MSEHLSEQSSSTDTQPWTCLNCGKENRGERRFCWKCEAVKGAPPGASPAKPLRSTPPSHTPDIEHPRTDSPPPSNELLTENNIAEFDFRIALQAGLIGAVVEFVLSFLHILAFTSTSVRFPPSSFVDLPFFVAITFLPWVVNIAVGALYVYITKRKGKVIKVGLGALGGAVTGIIYMLAGGVLDLIRGYITKVVFGSSVSVAFSLSLTIWGIALTLAPTVFLSTIGGLVGTASVQTKPSETFILRMTVGCVVGFVGLIVGYFGLLNFLGDSNALGFYCNIPVALALLIFAWVMIRPRQ